MSATAPKTPLDQLNVVVIPVGTPPDIVAKFKADNVGSGFVQLVALTGASASLLTTTAGTGAAPAAVSTGTLGLIAQLLESGLEVGATILFPDAGPLLPYVDLVIKNGVPWLVNMIGGTPVTETWTLEKLLAEPGAARPTP